MAKTTRAVVPAGTTYRGESKRFIVRHKFAPQNLIQAIVYLSSTRKDFIADTIIQLNPRVVGIYRLLIKHGSDAFRPSIIKGVIKPLGGRGSQGLSY